VLEEHDAVVLLEAHQVLDRALGHGGDLLDVRGGLRDDEDRDVLRARGDALPDERVHRRGV
jgi:hypothetical protein